MAPTAILLELDFALNPLAVLPRPIIITLALRTLQFDQIIL